MADAGNLCSFSDYERGRKRDPFSCLWIRLPDEATTVRDKTNASVPSESEKARKRGDGLLLMIDGLSQVIEPEVVEDMVSIVVEDSQIVFLF